MSNNYLISDAAKQVKVEAHVLRYWEEELGLPIKRNELGHRFYTIEDVDRFREIKNLKERGLQLKAIRMILKDGKLDMLSPMQGNPPEEPDRKEQVDREQVKQNQGKQEQNKQEQSRQEQSRQEQSRQEQSRQEQSKQNQSRQDQPVQNQVNQEQVKAGQAGEEQNGYAVSPGEEERSVEVRYTGNDIIPAAEAGVLYGNESAESKTQRLQWLLQRLFRETLQENNKELCRDMKESILKELDYQFRVQEEREDERNTERRQREEDHFKRIDELLRKKRRIPRK